ELFPHLGRKRRRDPGEQRAELRLGDGGGRRILELPFGHRQRPIEEPHVSGGPRDHDTGGKGEESAKFLRLHPPDVSGLAARARRRSSSSRRSSRAFSSARDGIARRSSPRRTASSIWVWTSRRCS